MSEASVEACALHQHIIQLSNEYILDRVQLLGGAATAEEVIVAIFGSEKVPAIIGKRRSQPVYRALSELAQAGQLDDSETVVNADTGYKNSLYRIPPEPLPPRPGTSYKHRYELALEIIEELKVKVQYLEKRLKKYTGNIVYVSPRS